MTENSHHHSLFSEDTWEKASLKSCLQAEKGAHSWQELSRQTGFGNFCCVRNIWHPFLPFFFFFGNSYSSNGRLPWWLRWLKICLQCRRPGLDRWVRKIPWRREWQPTPVFVPGEFHGQSRLVCYSLWACKVSHDWATNTHFSNSDVKGSRSVMSDSLRPYGLYAYKVPLSMEISFTCGSAGKESACSAGDLGLITGLGRSPGEGKGYSLQYSGLENSRDCTVYGVAKSWTWQWFSNSRKFF